MFYIVSPPPPLIQCYLKSKFTMIGSGLLLNSAHNVFNKIKVICQKNHISKLLNPLNEYHSSDLQE